MTLWEMNIESSVSEEILDLDWDIIAGRMSEDGKVLCLY